MRGGYPRALGAGDLDGDGQVDLAVSRGLDTLAIIFVRPPRACMR